MKRRLAITGIGLLVVVLLLIVRNGIVDDPLERLKRSQEAPSTMPDSLVAFGISTGTRQGLKAMFSSHPPLDARIAALKELG